MLDAETQEEEIIDDESFHLWWFFFFKCSLKKKIINFGCAGFMGFSPVAPSEGCPAAAAPGLLSLQSLGSRCLSCSSCILRAQWPRHTDLIAPQRVRLSRTRDKPCVPRVGTVPPGKPRFPRFLNEWPTEAVLLGEILLRKLLWSDCLCPPPPTFTFTS